MRNPRKEHWVAFKWIHRYLKGTTSVCLRFSSSNPVMEGFTDSDMSADVDTTRSTSGYAMTYAGGAVSCYSRLLKVVALSTMEPEYIVVIKADKEVIWMRDFISELGIQQEQFRLVMERVRTSSLFPVTIMLANVRH